MNPYENISLYKDKTALSTKGISKHLNNYDLISDQLNEDGTRTITIKPTDMTKHLQLCQELADAMVEKLGEGKNKLLRTMLYDTLRDYEGKSIIRMHKRVVLGETPVKYKEGCFKLIIGDGRKRNHDVIMLVE